MLDVEGAVLDELALPAVPAQPLVVVDWDMDGLNDIVLLSQRGIYGWAQARFFSRRPCAGAAASGGDADRGMRGMSMHSS